MTFALDRVDSAPIISQDLDPQFLQWIWVLIDTLNETIRDIENGFNLFEAPSYALLTETVTLTLGSPSFTVANGSLYNVGDNVVGTGMPPHAIIISISGNTVTIDNNATANGAHALTFIPTKGVAVEDGLFIYDTTNKVYVGMQNGALVKFTTTSYP